MNNTYSCFLRNNFKEIETPSIDRNPNIRKAELSQLPGFRIFFIIVLASVCFPLQFHIIYFHFKVLFSSRGRMSDPGSREAIFLRFVFLCGITISCPFIQNYSYGLTPVQIF